MADEGKLAELLARVEAADWPRDVVLYSPFLRDAAKLLGLDDDDRHSLHLTLQGSLDAAIGLVEKMLPEWHWGVNSVGECHLYRTALDPPRYIGEAKTPALALLAALLEALIANERKT